MFDLWRLESVVKLYKVPKYNNRECANFFFCLLHFQWRSKFLDLSSTNPAKWSNTFKQIVSCCRGTGWKCLTISWVGAYKVKKTLSWLKKQNSSTKKLPLTKVDSISKEIFDLNQIYKIVLRENCYVWNRNVTEFFLLYQRLEGKAQKNFQAILRKIFR